MSRGSAWRLAWWIAAALSVMNSPWCAAQTVVTLRGSAKAASDAKITIGDVADIRGDDADAITKVVLAERANTLREIDSSRSPGWREITVADVRAALDKARINLGRTTLRGSVCAVRVGGEEPAREAKTERSATTKKAEPTEVDFSGVETMRHRVALAMSRHLNVETIDMRLAFDDRDNAFLSQNVAGRRVDVQPAAASANDVIPSRVYIYQGERMVDSRTVSVRAMVRREQVSATRAIERREELDESMLSRQNAWVSAAAPVSAETDQLIGAAARRRIGVGEVITANAVEQPLMVKKGDKVEVHCLSGSVTLKAMRARALADGRDGDYIAFQIDGSKKPFSARVSGRGLAVLTVGVVSNN